MSGDLFVSPGGPRSSFAAVTLDDADMRTGFDQAKSRYRFFDGHADRVPTPDARRATVQCEGVRAEIAVMRWTGAPVRFPRNWKHHEAPDVLPDIEVRWRSEPWHDLIVRRDDVLSRRFVLVKGRGPDYELRGWIYGTEAAEHPEWLEDAGGYGLRSWFVPEQHLRPMSALAKYGDRQR